MNRKEEMEALIEDCERYAKIIEGIQVAPDNWKDGDPTRREPRETLLKCAAALRASAAPVAWRWQRPFGEIGEWLITKEKPTHAFRMLEPLYTALRASAAPEEGMNHRTTAEPDLGSGHRSAEDALLAHKVMTREEYAAINLKGWHLTCFDYDGAGGVGIRYLGERP